ncbi:MAG: ornithine cyclodeaminase family protein [Candidatus Velthaea sp.]
MLTIDEPTAERVLATLDMPALMGELIAAQSAGDTVVPVRAAGRAPGIWFAAMPAFVRDRALGAKLVVAADANARGGRATHQATIVLLDARTGALEAIVAGEAITRARTAAFSLIATRRMAARPRGRHAILGAGAQGRAHLEMFARFGAIERLAVWSRTAEHARLLAGHARTIGLRAEVFPSARDAVRECDVVTTVTGSPDPLFAVEDVLPLVHVNAVGACVPDKREIPADFVRRARVAVDSLAAAHVESGDLLLALAPDDERWNRVTELGAAQRSVASPTLFVSLGVGSADVLTAAAIVARVREANAPSYELTPWQAGGSDFQSLEGEQASTFLEPRADI